VRENQDPCQVWRDEIERLHQGISQFEEVIDLGEVPPGMEDVFRERLEKLKRDLRDAQRQLEKCEDATRRD
jgi:hypothetical protein